MVGGLYYNYIAHRIHLLTGIFIYMWLDLYGIHVGKYTIIDPLGPGILTPICCLSSLGLC